MHKFIFKWNEMDASLKYRKLTEMIKKKIKGQNKVMHCCSSVHTLSFKVSWDTVEGKLFRGMSTNVVIPPVETQWRQMIWVWNRRDQHTRVRTSGTTWELFDI